MDNEPIMYCGRNEDGTLFYYSLPPEYVPCTDAKPDTFLDCIPIVTETGPSMLMLVAVTDLRLQAERDRAERRLAEEQATEMFRLRLRMDAVKRSRDQRLAAAARKQRKAGRG